MFHLPRTVRRGWFQPRLLFILATMPAIQATEGGRPFGPWTIETWAAQGSTELSNAPGQPWVRFVVPAQAKNTWDNRAKLILGRALDQGARYLFDLSWRSEGQPGRVRLALLSAATEREFFHVTRIIPTTWTSERLILDCQTALAQQQLVAYVDAGCQAQTTVVRAPSLTLAAGAASADQLNVVMVDAVSPRPAPGAWLARPDQWSPWGEPAAEWTMLDPLGKTKPCLRVATRAEKSTMEEVGLFANFLQSLVAGKRYLLTWPMRTRRGKAAVTIRLVRPQPPYPEYAIRELGIDERWQDFKLRLAPSGMIPAEQIALAFYPGSKPAEVELGMPRISTASANGPGDVAAISPQAPK